MEFFRLIFRGCLFGFLSLSCNSIFADTSTTPPKIIFSCAAISPSTPIYQRVQEIYTQAFANLGYSFNMITAPNLNRALAEASHGGADGDCARVEFLNDMIADSSLIRVNVKILETKLAAWSRDPKLKIDSVNSIKASHFSIVYPRGSLIAERYIFTHHLPDAQAANTPESSIKLLLAQRYDLLLLSPDVVIPELQRLHWENSVYNAGVLESYDVYPYINKRYISLVPKLEVELKKLISSKEMKMDQLTSIKNDKQ